ncbi:predicted protein [Naegleria gruberi]|uniref:Predicted protein n=1 Tax=Naegleria gruberi TaxID=5762 RepID=D2VYI2_NAEGR|nr:uncharacterized protein NAEGRDRAFT_74130 [Naegleria gruberi]EFC38114.1 predicted protein [Naegleria gruberi]|eukprot:XP_002670858.1 predicted protein [Naegleria gruberi strain NEG-M]
MSTQPRVVIVGGGVAGLSVLSTLTSHFVAKSQTFNITLIEKKNFTESSIFTLRYMVNPQEYHHENSHVLLDELEKTFDKRNGYSVKMISHSQASKLDTEHSKITIQQLDGNSIKGEETIEYDYLILANGCRYKTDYIKANIEKIESVTPQSRLHEFHQFYDKITSKENDHVVIVGGGALGIQLAGELIDVNQWRGKHGLEPFKITLVHSRKLLRDRSNSETAHNYIYNHLVKNGVEVFMGKRAFYKDVSQLVSSGEETNPLIKKEIVLKPNIPNAELTSEQVIELPKASMIFWCGGMIPNTEWLEGSHIARNSQGFIQVNDFYQTVNHPNIFSLGDVTDLPYEKLAGSAVREGITVGTNIVKMSNFIQQIKKVAPQFSSTASMLKNKEKSGKFELSLGSINGLIGKKEIIEVKGQKAADIMTEKGRNRAIGLLRNPEIFIRKFGEFIQSNL